MQPEDRHSPFRVGSGDDLCDGLGMIYWRRQGYIIGACSGYPSLKYCINVVAQAVPYSHLYMPLPH